jgi:predicted ATPase
MGPHPWTLRIEDLRTLEKVEWSPDGVCVVVGPNGSGKTTLLNALMLLSLAFSRDMDTALRHVSPAQLRRVNSAPNDPVILDLTLGDVRWVLMLPAAEYGLRGYYGEELYHQDRLVLRSALLSQQAQIDGAPFTIDPDERRCLTRILWDRDEPEWLKSLSSWLRSLRIYKDWYINQLRQPWQRGDSFSYLNNTGNNLWTVLDTWDATRTYRGQFRWVIEKVRLAFPAQLESIEFEPGVRVFRPGASQPGQGLPPDVLADGLLTALLQLTAVAGAKEGSTLAFDEMENQLHPFAIRVILGAMREEAERKGLTILLTTHSPEVLNEFRGEEDRVFVLGEPGRVQPVPLADLVHEDELPIAYIGERYLRERFAPQSAGARARR